MATPSSFDALREQLTSDSREAFSAALAKIGAETVYGFAIYTDDSAVGFDVALNSTQSLDLANSRPRSVPFENRWYTISWAYEGGYAAHLDSSSSIAENLAPANNDAYDSFRANVFQCMIDALAALKRDGFFQSLTDADQLILQVAVTDSEDDDELMDNSIRKLNSDSICKLYEAERADAGY